ESIRALRVAILATLTEPVRSDPTAALTYARARLQVDPFSEDAHLSVIELLSAAGETRAALQQYESCRRMLTGQLGARPSAALERARAALGSVRPEATAPAVVFLSEAPSTRLVGRIAE